MKNFLLICFVLINYSINAQCTCINGTTSIAAGGSSSAVITIPTGQLKCIAGPTSGTPATYSGTVNIAGTGQLCISGLVTFSGTINATTTTATLNIATGAVVNYTGAAQLLGGSNSGNKRTFNNSGTFNYNKGTGQDLSLENIELNNTGFFNTQGNLNFNNVGVAMTQRNTGTITVAKTINFAQGGADNHTINFEGKVTCDLFKNSGTDANIFINISGLFKVLGTGSGSYAFDKGQGLLTITGTLLVPNDTTYLNGTAGVVSNGKIYTNGLYCPAFKVDSNGTCLSIYVINKTDLNSGNIINGRVYIYDETETDDSTATNANGDVYAGSTFSNGGGRWNGWYDLNKPSETDIVYSGTVTNKSAPTGCAVVTKSEFTILPLEIISFVGKNKINHNLISWSAFYKNTRQVQLEKSYDGLDFFVIETKNINQEIQDLQKLEYKDYNLTKNKLVYYRLKSFEKDKVFTLSNQISIIQNEININSQISIKPTISHGENIFIESDLNYFTWNIKNMTGEIIKSGECENKETSINIDELKNGLYFISVNSENSNSYFKIIITK